MAENPLPIKHDWKFCKTDSDCAVVQDLGCSHQCRVSAINKKHLKSLSDYVSKSCGDVITPPVTCANDTKARIPKCLGTKCFLMTKHNCCLKNAPKSCRTKETNCRLRSHNPMMHPCCYSGDKAERKKLNCRMIKVNCNY